jgi:hypothetical protein
VIRLPQTTADKSASGCSHGSVSRVRGALAAATLRSVHCRELLQKTAKKVHSKKIFTEGNGENKDCSWFEKPFVTFVFFS